MLVLTCRLGECIRIGDDISIRVLDIQRGQVRMAIDAPRRISIHREEIYEQVQRENKSAAESTQNVDPTVLWRSTRGKKS